VLFQNRYYRSVVNAAVYVQFLIVSSYLSVSLSVCVFVIGTTSPLHFRCYSKFVIIFFNTSTCAALNFNSVRSRVRIP
jgi:hypothetical protein